MTKKILVIEPSGNLYGSEMVLMDILTNIKNKDLDFTVVIPPGAVLSEELHKYGINHIDILNIHHGPVQKIVSYLKVILYLLRNRFHLIFINQAGILRAMALIAKILGIPVVCEVSTLEDGLLVNGMHHRYLRNVKSFICNSKFIAENLHVPDSQKSILYYGYQWKKLNPLIRTETNPFHIVLLGRISESKGHFLLVKAMKELRSRLDNEVKIFFVGDAPNKETDEKIKLEIASANLESYFVFRGFQHNLNRELSDKNLMVIPSLKEPFGRIFCESAEAGLPVIVADSGGLGELSKTFNLGLPFQGSNTEDLAKKIEFSIHHYESLKNNFESSAKRMLHSLSMNGYIQCIEEILRNAILRKNCNIEWYGETETLTENRLNG